MRELIYIEFTPDKTNQQHLKRAKTGFLLYKNTSIFNMYIVLHYKIHII